MRYFVRLLLSLACLFLFANKAISKVPIEVKGDSITYLEGGKVVVAKGHVVITYENMRLTCEEAEVDLRKNLAKAKGDVVLVEPRGVMHGDAIEYDFQHQKGKVIRADFEIPPYYGASEVLKRDGPNEYEATACYITTCDPSKPHPLNYRLEADEVKIYPGDRVEAKRVRLKVGKITLFYFPRYVHRLDDRRPNVKVVPGHDDDWGLFLLTTYKQNVNSWLDWKFNLDWREKRGIGFGPDVFYHSNYGSGILRTYYIREKDEELLEELGGLRKEKRYKVQWIHTWNLSQSERLTLEFHKFSDYYFLKDYYYNEEFEYDPTPSSYMLYTKSNGYGTLSLYLKKRVNHFYTETEYLPQVKFTLYSYPLVGNELYIKGSTEFSNLSRRFSTGAPALSAWRWDTYLQMLYSSRIGVFEFSPFVGIRQTYYSRDKSGEEGLWRGVFYTGFDLSTHLYRTYFDSYRHVLRPYVSYRYNPWPTVRPTRLQQFDWIDSISRVNRLEFGVENLLQGKTEKGEVKDLIRLDGKVTYQIKPEGGSYFDYLELDMELKALPGVRLDAEYRYGLEEGAWRYGSIDLWFARGKRFSLGLGHEYKRSEMAQTTLETMWKVVKGWEFKTYHRYEFETGALQEQTYSITKDLGCWELELSYTNEKYGNDTFWVIMRIKAFPDVGIKVSKSYRRRQD